MDTIEADELLQQQLQKLRAVPYSELKRLVEERIIQVPEVKGPSGVTYYLEIQAFWDDRQQRNIRVVASIDDGGKWAWHPHTGSFIKALDETFVGE